MQEPIFFIVPHAFDPKSLSDRHHALWEQAQRTYRVAQSGRPKIPWTQLTEQIGQGTLAVEALSLLYRHWYQTWAVIEPLIGQGAQVLFCAEGLLLSADKPETIEALAVVARNERLFEELRAQRAKAGVRAGMKEGKSNINWINPDQPMLRALARDVQRLGSVKAACEAHGISRNTYYKWRKNGRFDT